MFLHTVRLDVSYIAEYVFGILLRVHDQTMVSLPTYHPKKPEASELRRLI